MIFALLQEQHRAQLDTMASANQKAMDVMIERMNAIVAGNGPGPDKENLPPGGNVNPGNDTGTTKRKKKKCPHCGKTVFHKAAECYELEAKPANGGQDGSRSRRLERRRNDRDRGRQIIIVV